jgi:hypothetical protein
MIHERGIKYFLAAILARHHQSDKAILMNAKVAI